MAGLSSPLGVAAIIFIISGIISTVIGIILLISFQNQAKPWYVWLLLVGGVVLGILGGIMLAIALSYSTPTVYGELTTVPTIVPQPVVAAPVVAPSVVAQPQVVYQQPVYQQPVYPAGQATVVGGYASATVPVASGGGYDVTPPVTPGQIAAVAAQPNMAPVPQVVGTSAQPIGGYSFNPDPQTQYSYVAGTTQRVYAQGPYGPGGVQKVVSGVLQTPGQVQVSTVDYPKHAVNIVA